MSGERASMSCGQRDLRQGSDPVSGDRPRVRRERDRTRWRLLIVSDAPEAVAFDFSSPSDARLLYARQVSLPGGPVKVRLLMWHVNRITTGGQPVSANFYLVLRLLGATSGAGVSNHFAQVRIANPNASPTTGLCLAKAMLAQTVDTPGDHSDVLPDGDIIIGYHTVPSGQHLGALHEFDLALPEQQNVYIRTVVNNNSAAGVGNPSTPLLDPGIHIRGSWVENGLKSNLAVRTAIPDYNANPDLAQEKEWLICKRHAVDQAQFHKEPTDINGTADGNTGLFGVYCVYHVYSTNGHPTKTGFVEAHLHARDTRANPTDLVAPAYFGASSCLTGADITNGVLPIRFSTAGNTDNSVLLEVFSVPPGATVQRTYCVTNAGGATMPVGLRYRPTNIP